MRTSKSIRCRECVQTAMRIISNNGGEMRFGDIVAMMQDVFPNSDYEKEMLKSGTVRWESWLAFFSIDAVKTGYLVKNNGLWHITPEGEKALKLNPEAFDKSLVEGYDMWKKNSDQEKSDDKSCDNDAAEIEIIKSKASAGIRNYIINKNPYEFQDIVAALLRAMGYYTPFIAPKGKDGGVDIIAYKDPLGVETPRIKVQVKHYPTSPIPVDVVRTMIGVLSKGEDVGIIFTSGTFSSDSKREARSSDRKIRLIDLDEFVNLWLQYYANMCEEDRLLMPIIPVYFVDSNIGAQ